MVLDYKYAYDENNNLICIESINKENRGSHTYKCISCGKELVPKLGTIRTHHFAHKTNTTCNGETYLHLLAKQAINKRFNSDLPFVISLDAVSYCANRSNCPFYDEDCKSDGIETIDLKDYYNKSDIEKKVYSSIGEDGKPHCSILETVNSEKYIADVLLWNSDKIIREPIAIEICVSHSCNEKKLQSGLKIIEFNVKNEQDIESLISGEINWDEVKFYNFEKVKLKDKPVERVNLFSRFTFFRSGAAKNSTIEDYQYCSRRHLKHNPKSLVELNIGGGNSSGFNSDDDYLLGLAYLLNKGYKFKNCMLCKYYKGYMNSYNGEPFCACYKKSGIRRPYQSDAQNCSFYIFDTMNISKKQLEAQTAPIEMV